ncbi:MAG: hypothetical protein QM526_01795 [Alphaproteobacteria bacterium]|nr:hypothetical protein [Alphaproteobacteria bacterium]
MQTTKKSDTTNYPLLFVIIFFLANIFSFLFGGMLVYYTMKPVHPKAVFETIESIDEDARVYASSKGKTYYPWWCHSIIVDKNKIYFENKETAEAQGYTLAKTCQ